MAKHSKISANGHARRSRVGSPGRTFIPLLQTLRQLVDGREIEIRIHDCCLVSGGRSVSVYVHGDARDQFRACLASGHASREAQAIQNVINRWRIFAVRD